MASGFYEYIFSHLVNYRCISGFTPNLVVPQRGGAHFRICVRLRGKKVRSIMNPQHEWLGGCFATAAIDPPVCVPMYNAHTSLYLRWDFAFFVFIGSGADYPSDCSSWLQRLGLAKSKVGRNSSPGPDKGSSFHCPDAVNSAGGKPLLFFI